MTTKLLFRRSPVNRSIVAFAVFETTSAPLIRGLSNYTVIQ